MVLGLEFVSTISSAQAIVVHVVHVYFITNLLDCDLLSRRRRSFLLAKRHSERAVVKSSFELAKVSVRRHSKRTLRVLHGITAFGSVILVALFFPFLGVFLRRADANDLAVEFDVDILLLHSR
jgi:hypothetical protein